MLTLFSFLFFFQLVISITTAHDSVYVPPDNILLDCGSSSDTTASDGRNWTADEGSKFALSGEDNTSTKATAKAQGPSVTQVPYMTTRIFRSRFTYTFPVSSAGPKFIRLYFYSASYSDLDISKAFFSVTVGRYTLLSNFSASLTADHLGQSYFTREFSVNAEKDQRLNVTFTPSPDTSHAFAFVNGIEVVSMPSNLYTRGGDLPFFIAQQKNLFSIHNETTAMEMVYRLNVGGNLIPPADDTGMFRTWSMDDDYVLQDGVKPPNWNTTIKYSEEVPPYTAPKSVYSTARTMGLNKMINMNYNLTWRLPVDYGFNYFIRLHFCEYQPEVTQRLQRVFIIFINNQTAEPDADVIFWSGGNGIPAIKDYVVNIQNGSGTQQYIWIALHPVPEHSWHSNAILNGLEIFKLSTEQDNNLAGPNPPKKEHKEDPASPELSSENSKKYRTPVIIAGGVVGGFVALSILCFFVFWHRRIVKDSAGVAGDKTSRWFIPSHSGGSTKMTTSSLPSDLCRHFSLAEIKAATNNFHEACLIGIGGFGSVYKGQIDGGATTVAIKRANPTSQQGVHEFQTEIEMLSKLRHLHLVSLIGYCQEDKEMILVYDYMSHGTLRDHLYKTSNPPLTWKKRLEICIGAARGLHYLHAGAKHTIIHRDVKTTNLLLDEKWVAKLSDFGLSKMGPTTLSRTHVSTFVKGSFGYLDPEYFRRQQLTEKSDVYSFGVVLFEVLCARPPLIPTLENEQASLAEWARHCFRSGTPLHHIIDPYLRGKIAPECLKQFAEIAEKCVAYDGIERPAMGDVVWSLEFALQLQENADENFKGGRAHNETDDEETPFSASAAIPTDDDHLPSSVEHVSESRSNGTTVTGVGRQILASGSDDSERLISGDVFSEILNPNGR